MLGFVFPGETAAILGGVLASKGGVTLAGITVTVVLCAIVGDSIGYSVGDKWGRSLLQLGPLQETPEGARHRARPAAPPRRRRRVRRALHRLPARRHPGPGRACRRCATASSCPPTRPAPSAGARSTSSSATSSASGWRRPRGIASDILLGLIVVVIVVALHPPPPQGEAEFEGPAESAAPAPDAATRPRRRRQHRRRCGRPQPSGPSTERSPARSPATTRANSPAASSPAASVSSQRTCAGSRRSMP